MTRNMILLLVPFLTGLYVIGATTVSFVFAEPVQAGRLLYEPFDYPAGTGNLGSDGGYGTHGGNVVAGSLSYRGLGPGTGNKSEQINGVGERSFPAGSPGLADVFSTAGTYYITGLMNANNTATRASAWFSAGATVATGFGDPGAGGRDKPILFVIGTNGALTTVGTNSLSSSDTHMFAIRVINDGTSANDDVRLVINPTLPVEPDWDSFTAQQLGLNITAATTGNPRVTMSDPAHGNGFMDEFRVSNTWAGAIPEPGSLGLYGAKPMEVITEPQVKTAALGGVDVPTADVLRKMQLNQYILRAVGGKLTEVPVSRVVLPHSNGMSPQSVMVDLGPGGTVYVRQSEILCKSADGGRTWTSKPIKASGGDVGYRWRILRDGTFIAVSCTTGKEISEPGIVWASTDEGATWTQRASIPLDMKLHSGNPYAERYLHRGLNKLADDTLLWAVDIRNDDRPIITEHAVYFFRSTDGGYTWSDPIFVFDWGSEGGTALLPSGKILSALRYQRPTTAGDPPDLEKRNGSISKGWPWKHLFLQTSTDGGITWSTARQLTTVFGQTFGFPAAQSDGTVVVIHDTRYGPGPAGSRAMISRDEGETWRDEVYYLDYTRFAGSYTASVVLQDDTILTIAGSSQAGNDWNSVSDQTDLHAIRWKPVKD